MELSSTMQGVDYKENRKKEAHAEARPTIDHDLFLAFLLKMSLKFYGGPEGSHMQIKNVAAN